MLNNIMVDVETLSTTYNAVIIQLAAVKFSFKNDAVETFCINSTIKSSVDLGLSTTQDTIDWWKKQPKEVLVSVTKDAEPIQAVIEQFDKFLGNDTKNLVFWANGMNFDFPVIESTYKALSKPVPWKYWNLRDARTVYAVFGLDWKAYPRIGSYHNGLDDCLTQIKALKECLS